MIELAGDTVTGPHTPGGFGNSKEPTRETEGMRKQHGASLVVAETLWGARNRGDGAGRSGAVCMSSELFCKSKTCKLKVSFCRGVGWGCHVGLVSGSGSGSGWVSGGG